MRYGKSLIQFAVAAGMVMIGASAVSAADWRDIDHDRRDLREDYRDMRQDYARVDYMRADIARDRARLDEDIRCGRQEAAARDAADLARDQRALNAQIRDIRHDRNDAYWDRRDIRSDYRRSWR
jgi:hypothetical protein